jgi:hypothetical protein
VLGDFVGNCVGDSDGAFDRANDGASVGCWVGDFDGDTVGRLVFFFVGRKVGSGVLGTREGCLLGGSVITTRSEGGALGDIVG